MRDGWSMDDQNEGWGERRAGIEPGEMSPMATYSGKKRSNSLCHNQKKQAASPYPPPQNTFDTLGDRAKPVPYPIPIPAPPYFPAKEIWQLCNMGARKINNILDDAYAAGKDAACKVCVTVIVSIADTVMPPPPKQCPPCTGALPDPTIHWEPGEHGCQFGHWHFHKWNQNPETCDCYPQRLFGGCLFPPFDSE